MISVPEQELIQLRDELRGLQQELDSISRRRVDVSMALQRVERLLVHHEPRRSTTLPMQAVRDPRREPDE